MQLPRSRRQGWLLYMMDRTGGTNPFWHYMSGKGRTYEQILPIQWNTWPWRWRCEYKDRIYGLQRHAQTATRLIREYKIDESI